MAKEKISETAVGSPAPVVAYAGSAEAALIAPHRRVTIASNVVGANYFTSASLYTDDIDSEDSAINDSDTETDSEGESEVIQIRKAPFLMDIELVSNKIVYDATGNPSGTVIFKIRNSSGETIKSVNARVKVV